MVSSARTRFYEGSVNLRERIRLFGGHYLACRRRLGRLVSLRVAWDLAVAKVPVVIAYDVDVPSGHLVSLRSKVGGGGSP